MNTISLIDETYNSLNAEHYFVTLQILPESISFSVLDTVRKKHILFNCIPVSDEKLIPTELNNLFNNEELFNLPLGNIRALVFNEHTTIIPAAFSLKENLTKVITFNFGDNSSNEILQCKTPFDATLAYSIPVEIHEILTKKGCSAILPHALSLLNEAYKTGKLKDHKKTVTLNLLNQFAQIAVVDDEKLIFFNIFTYKTAEDLCYFTVYLYDLFKLDKEKTAITVSGVTEKNDKRIQVIQQFIKEIQFSKTSAQHLYSYRFNEIPEHHYSSHFILPYENY